MSHLTPAPRQPPWLEHRPRYRPDIEGLRAIAVLLIVAFHAGVPGFTGGFVGVDVRDKVCVIGECEAMEGELVRYRDDDHLSVEFAQTLTPVFVALLNGPQELSRTLEGGPVASSE